MALRVSYPTTSRLLILLHALVLFNGLRGDSGRGLRAVAYLRVGGGGADGAPCLAAAETNCYAGQHC